MYVVLSSTKELLKRISINESIWLRIIFNSRNILLWDCILAKIARIFFEFGLSNIGNRCYIFFFIIIIIIIIILKLSLSLTNFITIIYKYIYFNKCISKLTILESTLSIDSTLNISFMYCSGTEWPIQRIICCPFSIIKFFIS